MRDLTLMGQAVGDLLRARQQTVAVAESSTGGLISAALLAVPGASAYFLGGGVIYTVVARRTLLAAPDDTFAGVRPSTEEYAMRMARAVRQHLGATWGLSETGATGPTGNRYGDPPGHTCIAIAGPVERVTTVETRHSGRELNMWVFAAAALDLLAASITQSGGGHP
ncbi:MAG: CinA family protein [Candidatus Binatia bacterium]|nr:CinA family protein [Candidatus Binatia bacterium]